MDARIESYFDKTGKRMWKASKGNTTYFAATLKKALEAVKNHKEFDMSGAESFYGEKRYNGD